MATKIPTLKICAFCNFYLSMRGCRFARSDPPPIAPITIITRDLTEISFEFGTIEFGTLRILKIISAICLVISILIWNMKRLRSFKNFLHTNLAVAFILADFIYSLQHYSVDELNHYNNSFKNGSCDGNITRLFHDSPMGT